MFFVVRSNDSFNFPLGLIKYIVIQSIIDYGSTPWDSASSNTLKPLVILHKRALKAILLKPTTLAISDYTFLSILPLKGKFNYNKGALMHKVLRQNFLKPITAFWKAQYNNISVHRIDLFKSSLAYSGSFFLFFFNSLLLLVLDYWNV